MNARGSWPWGAASNLVGTINPIREIAELVHRAGAQLFVDAVHLAPHRLIDVALWDCDYLACSPYKFFGPHMGVLWGRSEIMAELPAYKVRAADDVIPDRWMTGTQCHEGIAGTLEAVNYLADLGREVLGHSLDRREALRVAFKEIEAYESVLCQRLIEGVARIAGARVVGITDANRLAERAPTVGILAEGRSPIALSEELGKRGIFSWGREQLRAAIDRGARTRAGWRPARRPPPLQHRRRSRAPAGSAARIDRGRFLRLRLIRGRLAHSQPLLFFPAEAVMANRRSAIDSLAWN